MVTASQPAPARGVAKGSNRRRGPLRIGPHASHHVDPGALRTAACRARRAGAGHQPLLGRPRAGVLRPAQAPRRVPELIDLAEWRRILAQYPAQASRFTVLFVGRFYHRKRVPVLLRAAAILRESLPELRVRIVGNGPCNTAWRVLARELHLDSVVTWLGDISRAQLAEEYNRAGAFCLPSVQEGFGIVLLEAMAAGKPSSHRAPPPSRKCAARRAGRSRQPGGIAAGIRQVYASPERRAALAVTGAAWVEQFDAPPVAQLFLSAVTAR